MSNSEILQVLSELLDSEKIITLENLSKFKELIDALYYKKTDTVANAMNADKATNDSAGNNIVNSYARTAITNIFTALQAFRDTGSGAIGMSKTGSDYGVYLHPADNITSNKDIRFQDKSGYVAMLDDIPDAVTVDSEMSATSENPVQNKVVNTAISDAKLAAMDYADSKVGTLQANIEEGTVIAYSATNATNADKATNATKAAQDAAGRNIQTTYATKNEVGTVQTNLNSAIAEKQDTLIAGTNITIVDNVISATGKDIPDIPEPTSADAGKVLGVDESGNYVLQNANGVEIVSSVDDMTDTSKTYVLESTGTIWKYGTTPAKYTNQVPLSTNEDGEIYNGVGYKNGYRWNSSQAEVVEIAGQPSVTTGLIPCSAGDTIYFSGLYLEGNTGGQNTYFYNSYGDTSSWVTPYEFYNNNEDINSFSPFNYNQSEHRLYSLTVPASIGQNGSVKFTLMGTDGANAIITVNEEITGGSTGWYDTGIPYSADLSDDIVSLQTQINDLYDKIEDIESGGGDTQISVPEYWQSALTTAVSEVKNHESANGINTFSFLLLGDIHLGESGVNDYLTSLGVVLKYLMDKCDVSFAAVVGDSTSQGTEQTVDNIFNNMELFWNLLSPVVPKNILLGLGNHDGATGAVEYEGTTAYYRNQQTIEQRYNCYFRKQATDLLRNFGPDGTYFYIDDSPNKIRYVVINPVWNVWAGNASDGFVTDIQHSFFHNAFIGQAQFNWLTDIALNVQTGWNIIILTHVVPDGTDARYFKDYQLFNAIVNAFNNKTSVNQSYTGTETFQNSSVNKDFSGTNGEIIAIFGGHKHADSVNTTSLSCPMITITTCGAYWDVRDANPPTRTAGTVTEFAFDVVTIDKTARKIYLTRIGAGSDREVDY